MTHKYPPVHYNDYLSLDKILQAQNLRSEEFGIKAHDEMLFIIVHQTYELWFKQIITELDSMIDIFSGDRIAERDMGTIVSRLHRVIEILKLLIDQVGIIETMTPLDFLEFRDILFPASGFQSHQFRMLENKLGLKSHQRLKYNSQSYEKSLPEEQSQQVLELEQKASLLDFVDGWLARTPFLKGEGFDFWEAYKKTVTQNFENELNIINTHDFLQESDKKRNRDILEGSQKVFETLFSEELYQKARAQGHWKLSYKAVHAALLIQLYRDQPIFQIPFQLIRGLLDLDELMTTWRYRHALMAKRMLGSKIGTGGSSGYDYLKQTSEKHRIFNDFFQLTTFFIPKSQLPELPKKVQERLGFDFRGEK